MESPDPKWTVNSTTVTSVVQAAGVLGAPADSLLAEAGIDIQLLNDPEERHPVAALYRLYELVAESTGNPDIGIYAGRIDYINRLNLQLYTCSVCETFRDYLNLMPSALRFAGDIGEVKIRREGEQIRLDWVPLWQASERQRFQSDEMLTTSAMIVRSLCVQTIPVRSAHFTYPEPDDLTLLREVFGNELYFDQPVSCLYFDRASLYYPVVCLDSDWSRALNPSVSHLFDRNGDDDFLAALRSTVIKMLPRGGVTIDQVAQEQGISRRTLQRRLTDRDTQFAQLLQELRDELAVQYLADERLSITDIAFLLGYADHGSFSSAFKGWHGVSPREFRKR